jgi:hypothetical protein
MGQPHPTDPPSLSLISVPASYLSFPPPDPRSIFFRSIRSKKEEGPSSSGGRGGGEDEDGEGKWVVDQGQKKRVFKLMPRNEAPSLRFETGKHDRYIWQADEETSAYSGLMLTLVLLLVFALTLQSLWPPVIRNIIWYIAVTFLLFLLGTTVLQFIVFGICWVFGWEVWILPNLWGDDIYIFSPLYSVEKAKNGNVWARIALAITIAGMGVWAYQQPTEFQSFLDTQKQMVDDLYTGKLLSDTAAGQGNLPAVGAAGGPFGWNRFGPGAYRYGNRPAHIPSLEEIEKLGDEEGGDAKKGADAGADVDADLEGEEGATGEGSAKGAAASDDEVTAPGDDEPAPVHAQPDLDDILSRDDDSDSGAASGGSEEL